MSLNKTAKHILTSNYKYLKSAKGKTARQRYYEKNKQRIKAKALFRYNKTKMEKYFKTVYDK